jgi:Holliday junction DNA helicase RuvA
MIGRIRGILLEKSPPWIVVDVMGVGYELQAPMNTFYHCGAVGEEISLYTHMIVREDAQLLYGFSAKQECKLFKEVIKVNGIGAKAALALLSGLSVEELQRAITMEEVGLLKKIPGIGPKTAQRIIVELQDKAKKWGTMTGIELMSPNSAASLNEQSIYQAVQALVALGYKNKDAEKAVDKIEDKSLPCEDIIRHALQGLARA